MSNLQKNILTHICTTYNASYETLRKETEKNRITIMQSLNSLINYHYVDKKRTNPEFLKSKIIFYPTYKGIAFAHIHLQVTLMDMISINKKDKIDIYITLVKEAFPSRYEEMLSGLFSKLERGALEINKTEAQKEKLINRCFREGIMSLASNYNGKDLGLSSTKKSAELFNNLFSQREIRELKKYFVKVRRDLDFYINQIPF